MNSKWIYFTAILFGASSLLLSFFAYSVVFAFLSIPGIILSLRLRKWNRSAAVVAFSINAIAFTRLLYVILLVNIASMNASKVVHQYYFPKEQTGCFELLFNVDGQDSITTEWQLKKNIIKIFIPPSRTLETSSKAHLLTGRHTSEFYYYNELDTIPFDERTSFNKEGIRVDISGNDQRYNICLSK